MKLDPRATIIGVGLAASAAGGGLSYWLTMHNLSAQSAGQGALLDAVADNSRRLDDDRTGTGDPHGESRAHDTPGDQGAGAPGGVDHLVNSHRAGGEAPVGPEAMELDSAPRWTPDPPPAGPSLADHFAASHQQPHAARLAPGAADEPPGAWKEPAGLLREAPGARQEGLNDHFASAPVSGAAAPPQSAAHSDHTASSTPASPPAPPSDSDPTSRMFTPRRGTDDSPAAGPASNPRSLAAAAIWLRADSALKEGQLATAFKLYTGPDVDAALVDPSILFRRTLCAEFLGQLDDALEGYVRLADLSPTPAWRGFARWGQARVLQAQGQPELALEILCDLALLEDLAAPDWREELSHWLGAALAERTQHAAAQDLLLDHTLARAACRLTTNDLLTMAIKVHGRTAPAAGEGRLATVRVVQEFPMEGPEGVRVRIDVGRASVRDALALLADACRWRLVWSPAAEQAAAIRTCDVQVGSLGAAEVLDLVCELALLEWSFVDGELRLDAVDRDSPVRERHRAEAAVRRLQSALLADPEHRWSAMSRLTLVQLSARLGDVDAARRQVEELLERDTYSPVAAEAWFNLGKLHLLAHRDEDALRAFEHAADHASGTTLEPVSYLLLGRLHLEAGRPMASIRSLRRAYELSTTASLREPIVLLLAGAYLAHEAPLSASQLIRERQAILTSPAARDWGAFLNSLALATSAREVHRRTYDMRNLTSAVSHVRAEEFPGRFGPMLMADAYELLNLRAEASDTLAAAAEQSPPGRLQDRMRLRLIELIEPLDDGAAVAEQLEALAGSAAPEVAFEARRKRSEQLLAGDQIPEARAACWELLKTPDATPEQQRAVLRTLGRCYERTGDRLSAALCFAGTRPFVSPTAPDRPVE